LDGQEAELPEVIADDFCLRAVSPFQFIQLMFLPKGGDLQPHLPDSISAQSIHAQTIRLGAKSSHEVQPVAMRILVNTSKKFFIHRLA
jgi:hypothetical protein